MIQKLFQVFLKVSISPQKQGNGKQSKDFTPRKINGQRLIAGAAYQNVGEKPAMDQHPIQEQLNTDSYFMPRNPG